MNSRAVVMLFMAAMRKMWRIMYRFPEALASRSMMWS